MSVEGCQEADWEWFTFRRVRVCRELAALRSQREVADRLCISYNTVRSHVEELKARTGCEDVREIGRWWQANRAAWVAWCACQAGPDNEEGYGAYGG